MVLPLILLWMIACLGYDARARAVQIPWIVLPLHYLITDLKQDNINGVFG